ncbi:glucose 1-dehydrogenase [Labrys sp. LIt4]|uniref:SDR family NAD(P)-dependent oxidoreductase n=1 Tax=Labrys sp. LIt4 TaxID=2821355 RepID=UPI001ADF1394|nr:glucose 1-dehydrogenase [Labrys sp. LIt4]MBP0580527.1 glucose 1-dehydrogenase [Labrys sp. LIt4]
MSSHDSASSDGRLVDSDLSGRTAVVTGASSGLGRHFAAVLARAGAKIIIGARRLEKLEEVREEIAALGADVGVVQVDVADPASVEQAFRDISAAGGLDILVNNAGVTVTKPALDVTEQEWDQVLDTNLKGAFLMSQAAAHAMKGQGRAGAIVNIASILGQRVAGQLVAYTASKAALIQMSKALALEFARFGIRVNALCPGYIETDLNHGFFASEAGQALVRRIPQRRLGRLEELDGPLLLLCSDAGSYITGAALAVDGGHLVSSL